MEYNTDKLKAKTTKIKCQCNKDSTFVEVGPDGNDMGKLYRCDKCGKEVVFAGDPNKGEL